MGNSGTLLTNVTNSIIGDRFFVNVQTDVVNTAHQEASLVGE